MSPETLLMTTAGTFAVMFGLVAGSFANVGIHRWPAEQSAWGRSACPRCNTPIAAYDNIPVLSYVLLRGACRQCGQAIPPSYPLVELLGGLTGLLLFWQVCPEWTDLDRVHLGAFGLALTYATLLIIATYSDLKTWILPNEVTIYAVPIGILGSVALHSAGYDGAFAVTPRESVIACAIAGSSFFTLRVAVGAAIGREALGMGDVKLVMMMGAFIGWGLWLVMFISTFLGMFVHLGALIIRRESTYLPYGPILCVGAAIELLWGDELLRTFFPGVYWLATYASG